MIYQIPNQSTLSALAASKRSIAATEERIDRLRRLLAQQQQEGGLAVDELIVLIRASEASRQALVDNRIRVLRTILASSRPH